MIHVKLFHRLRQEGSWELWNKAHNTNKALRTQSEKNCVKVLSDWISKVSLVITFCVELSCGATQPTEADKTVVLDSLLYACMSYLAGICLLVKKFKLQQKQTAHRW